MPARWLFFAVAAIALSEGLAVAQSVAPERVLVMPFENVKREPQIFWLGEASAVLLTDDLNALGGGAISREERRAAFDRLQVPSTAALTDATAIRISQIVGAADMIVGSLELDGDSLVVHARRIALETGRVTRVVVDRAPLPDLFSIFDRVARKLASSPPGIVAAGEPSPPLPAFENYIKGVLAETPSTAIEFLEAALSLSPSYDRARLALWEIYDEQGEYEAALAALEPVPANSPVARRARFLSALSYLYLDRFDQAFAAFKALNDARPAATLLNNLGIVQLRRGATPQSGLPEYYFNKAREADPSDEAYYFNLGYAYWIAHDPQAAVYWLREAARRNPADGDAHFVLGTALASTGSAAEAGRERELARRLSSKYSQRDKLPLSDAVPKGLERIKDDVDVPPTRSIEAVLAAGEQRDQRELARFYLDRARRLYQQENDREAVVELTRTLYLTPYDPDAHLLIGRIHLRHNRTREAIDAFKISLWSSETAVAHAALADAYLQSGDRAAARGEAERALALEPASVDAKRLLAQIDAR